MSKLRMMIRKSELSSEFKPTFREWRSIRQCLKYLKNETNFGHLGKITIERGIFWNENYKQITVNAELAARDQIAMIVVES